MNHLNDIRGRRNYLFFALVLIALLVVSFAQQTMHRVATNAPADAETDRAVNLLK